MDPQSMSARSFAGGQSLARVRGWVIFVGIVLLVLGIAAVIYDSTATRISVMLLGWLLVIAGVMQIVHAVQVRSWSGFFLYLLDGILRATVGTLLLLYPGSGALTITLILSFYFIVGGIFRTAAAMDLKFPSWGWTVFWGAVSIVLGVLLAMQWQTSSTWFVGFDVGVDLILSGWALLMFASVINQVTSLVSG